MIFKEVHSTRQYPEHGYKSSQDWSVVPPRKVKLNDLITTKSTLDLAAVLSEDSTFSGDLFPHVIEYKQKLYLEDGLHRAMRTALLRRTTIHARVLSLD